MNDLTQIAVSMVTNKSITLPNILTIDPRITILYNVNTDSGKLEINFSYVHFRGTIYDLTSDEGDSEEFNIEWDEQSSNSQIFLSAMITPVDYFISNILPERGYILNSSQRDTLRKTILAFIKNAEWSAWDWEG